MPSTNVGASSASNRLCAPGGGGGATTGASLHLGAGTGTGTCNVACNDDDVEEGLCWSATGTGTGTTAKSCTVSTVGSDGRDGINSMLVLGVGILGENDTGTMASTASTFQQHTQVKANNNNNNNCIAAAAAVVAVCIERRK